MDQLCMIYEFIRGMNSSEAFTPRAEMIISGNCFLPYPPSFYIQPLGLFRTRLGALARFVWHNCIQVGNSVIDTRLEAFQSSHKQQAGSCPPKLVSMLLVGTYFLCYEK